VAAADLHRTIEAVWHMESAKIIGGLARVVRDVGLAEDLAQDAFLLALEKWPETGIPDNPAAWLTTAAKRRGIDRLRRGKMLERKHEAIARALEELQENAAAVIEAAVDDHVGDDVLRLIFTSCHPILSADERVALTLRLLGGLSTDEIARAFLVPEATIAQRIVRAKKSLSDAEVPFEVPRGDELESRLASVLEVIYLIFNEGYAATAGQDWMRPTLCDEALRLGRILAELAPSEPEVHGLVSLMEIQASRAKARVDAAGDAVLLLDQDRSRWDRLLIRRGLAALERAVGLQKSIGPYTLQASIAACHARAREASDTDWNRIALLYRALYTVAPSGVVQLNLGVAVGMAEGPARGLEIVDALRDDAQLRSYHLLPAVRADLLFKLGRHEEARVEFERAASMTRNERERTALRRRAQDCLAIPKI
jgi:RNA polymerase sigma factor (sigma-70 family)